MIRILFEDALIMAVEKPSGTPSHSLQADESNTVEAYLKGAYPEISLFLLHRLDTGTSGVLLFAKNETIFKEMREQFKRKSIKKTYFAYIAHSNETLTRLKQLTLPYKIETPLAHHPKSKKRMISLPPDLHRVYRGKALPATTILESVSEQNFEGQKAFCIELQIITGVMHQIRVHLASMGLPLLGDPLYGKKEEASSVSRLGLHAKKIEFLLFGNRYQIEASDP